MQLIRVKNDDSTKRCKTPAPLVAREKRLKFNDADRPNSRYRSTGARLSSLALGVPRRFALGVPRRFALVIARSQADFDDGMDGTRTATRQAEPEARSRGDDGAQEAGADRSGMK